MKRACTLGSVTYDIFLNYEGADVLHLHKKRDVSSYILLKKGTKIDIPSIHKAVGGGAANVAVGLSRLGITALPYFRTGNDSAGELIRQVLADENISTEFCPVDLSEETALSIIIPSLENDNAALCFRGANRHQTKDEFSRALMTDLDLLFIGPLAGRSSELLSYGIEQAHQHTIPLAVNPGMAQLTEANQLVAALPSIDILIINAYESGFLLKCLLQEDKPPVFLAQHSSLPHLLNSYIHFGEKKYSLHDLAELLFQKGTKKLIVTNGAEGIYCITQENIYFHESIPQKKGFSLGAGDACTSGFLGAYLLGATIEDSLRYAVLNASSVIGALDAQTGLLSLEEIKKRMARVPHSSLHVFKRLVSVQE